jgi:hypothetical protein
VLPNDNQEHFRLNLQHHVFRMAANGALNLAPIPDGAIDVLDIGCGSGVV